MVTRIADVWSRCYPRVSASVVAVSTYVLLSVFAFRRFLFAPGTIGHNWDWSIPPDAAYMARAAEAQLFAWSQRDLGFPISLGLSFVPMVWLVLAAGALGVSGETVSKALILGTTLVSASSMFWLCRDILAYPARVRIRPGNHSVPQYGQHAGYTGIYHWGHYLAAWCAGCFYGFSPLLFGELIGGAYTLFISYAVSPLIFLGFRRALRANSLRSIEWSMLSGFALTVSSFALHYFVLDAVLLIAYAAVQRPVRVVARGVTLTLLFFTGSSAYWLAPLLLTLRGEVAAIASLPKNLNLDNLANAVPGPYEVLLGTGFFRELFFWAMSPAHKQVWFLIIACGAGWLFYQLLAADWRRRIEAYYWLTCLLAFMVFAMGLRSPAAGLVHWAYENIALVRLFRSPQRWMMAVTFCYAVCLGIGIDQTLARLISWTRLVRAAGLAAGLGMILWISPFVGGDLGRSYLRQYGAGNFVSQFRWAPSVAAWARAQLANPGDYRVVFLPLAYSPVYAHTSYQEEGQGGDPLVSLSPKPTLAADSASDKAWYLAAVLECAAYEGDDPQFVAKLAALLNVRFVGLRQDVAPVFTPCARLWDYERAKQLLEDGLRLSHTDLGSSAMDDTNLRAYELNDWLPHVYMTANMILIDRDPRAMFAALETADLAMRPAFITYEPNSSRPWSDVAWQQLFLSESSAIELFGRMPTSDQGTQLQLGGRIYEYDGLVQVPSNVLDLSSNQSTAGGFLHFSLGDPDTVVVPASVVVMKRSPTEYQLRARIPRQPIVVVLGESTHPEWTLAMEGGDFAAYHATKMLANGYANAWLLEPTGSVDLEPREVEMRIHFRGEDVFSRGLVASGGFVAAAIALLAVRGLGAFAKHGLLRSMRLGRAATH